MNIIGVSSNAYMDMPLNQVLDYLSVRTSFVEIMSGGRHSLFEYGTYLPSYSFRYSVHCSVSDGNISEPYECIRQASVKVIADIAEVCDSYNVETLVIHPGYCLEPDIFSVSESALLKSIEELGKMQEEFTVQFALENMGSLPCLHFRSPSFLETVRNAGLGFCLDVGHAYLNGELESFLRMHPNHMHLHDNIGMTDSHSACGSGNLNFREILKCDAKSAVIECMNPKDVEISLSYLTDLSKHL